MLNQQGYGDLGANHDGDSETPNWINLPWVVFVSQIWYIAIEG